MGAPKMCMYLPSTIYRFLNLPYTQRNQTHNKHIHNTTASSLAALDTTRVPPIYLHPVLTATTPSPAPTPALPSPSHPHTLSAYSSHTQTTVHASVSFTESGSISVHLYFPGYISCPGISMDLYEI